MNRILHTTIAVILSFLVIFGMNSCLESEDLMTKNAKTGGLISVTSTLQYKPASTESVQIEILIYQGPSVESIKVFKKYTHFESAPSSTSTDSDELLLKTISVNDNNTLDTILVDDSFTWDNLSQGIPMLPDGYTVPLDPVTAEIGDYFTLKYVAVLSDGREVSNSVETKIIVANFFAGHYLSHIKYFHPTLGGSYPYEPYYEDFFTKELFTLSNSDCYTDFGVWGNYGETMHIIINADNTVSFKVELFDYIVNEGDPYDLTKTSHYDPFTKTLFLYYHYSASGGYRVFWEILYPDVK